MWEITISDIVVPFLDIWQISRWTFKIQNIWGVNGLPASSISCDKYSSQPFGHFDSIFCEMCLIASFSLVVYEGKNRTGSLEFCGVISFAGHWQPVACCFRKYHGGGDISFAQCILFDIRIVWMSVKVCSVISWACCICWSCVILWSFDLWNIRLIYSPFTFQS